MEKIIMAELSKGAEKIILSLYEKTAKRHKRMSKIREYQKIRMLAFVPVPEPMKFLRKEKIYKSLKIYRTLESLEEKSIIKIGKKADISVKFYRKELMHGFGNKEWIDHYLDSAVDRDAVLTETKESPWIKKKRARKTAANRIIWLQRQSGVMWHPNEKFVFLTPKGMALGKSLSSRHGISPGPAPFAAYRYDKKGRLVKF